MGNAGVQVATVAHEVRLEVVSGPLKGRQFSLKKDGIRSGGQGFLLQDLEKERELAHGDQIRIGDSILVFQEAASPTTNSSLVLELDVSPTPTEATVLRKADALYLQSPQTRALPDTARSVRDLNVLLNFSKTVNSVRGLVALQQQVLEAILEIAPADRAAILLMEEGVEGLSSEKWVTQSAARLELGRERRRLSGAGVSVRVFRLPCNCPASPRSRQRRRAPYAGAVLAIADCPARRVRSCEPSNSAGSGYFCRG
jgi:hypothetical protein